MPIGRRHLRARTPGDLRLGSCSAISRSPRRSARSQRHQRPRGADRLEPWLYNQLAANLTGLLVVGFASGSERARATRAASAAPGSSGWPSSASASCSTGSSGSTARASTRPATTSPGTRRRTRSSPASPPPHSSSPLVLGLAFRRLPAWRGVWLPTVLAVRRGLATSALVSALGSGAATRAGSFAWFLWVALVALYADAPARRRAPDTVRV